MPDTQTSLRRSTTLQRYSVLFHFGRTSYITLFWKAIQWKSKTLSLSSVFLPFVTPSTGQKSVILWNNLYRVSLCHSTQCLFKVPTYASYLLTLLDFHHSIEGSELNICTREMTNIAVNISDLGNHVDRVIGELLNQVVMEVVDEKVFIFSSQK